MHYFLGIRPPGALVDSIEQFRQQQNWQGMEPHITVKAPCGLAGQGEWLPTVRQLCQATDALPIEISDIGTFGSAVLFLRVLSPALLALHRQLLHELRISTADQEACYENARYSPHLTLLHQPASAAYQLPMAAAATYFSETTSFRATELLVYSKAEGSIYQPLEAIPFGNTSVGGSFTITT